MHLAPGETYIDIDCTCSEIELYIPSDWNVVPQCNAFAGGCEGLKTNLMRAHPIIDYPYRWSPMLVLALVLSIIQATLSWGYTGADWLPAIIDGITTIGWLAALAYLAWFVVGQVSILQTNVITLDCGQLHGLRHYGKNCRNTLCFFCLYHTFQASVRHTDMDSHYIVVSPDSSESSGSTRR